MKKLKKFLILGIINIIVLFAFACMREVFGMPDASHVYHILSDDFFVIGVLNLCIGVLVWVSNEGVFDILGYGMRSFWGFFFKGFNKYADIYDYKESKHAEHYFFLHFMIFGGIFILLAYLFLKLI